MTEAPPDAPSPDTPPPDAPAQTTSAEPTALRSASTSVEAPAGPLSESPDDEAPTEPPERLRDAVLRALLGMLKLAGLLLPELVVGLLGAVVGLIVGLAIGVDLTSELFSGPGVWARAGPIALILPAITALGPPLVGLLVGLLAPPVLAILPHAAILAVVAWSEWRDRYAVVFAVAILA